jgi:hypothetical protein
MFGHGWVGVVVDVAPDDDDDDDDEDGTVVVPPLVAALATAKPIPILRPNAPPARARVASGFLSTIAFALSFLAGIWEPP